MVKCKNICWLASYYLEKFVQSITGKNGHFTSFTNYVVMSNYLVKCLFFNKIEFCVKFDILKIELCIYF